ncbi:methyl-accepting chemotaxis sensory transducer [Rhodopseudomonas palustris HaA2]|uniref:Methyl-accepting chemotaxis sensory transducer n=1 Tax=Rhodopseudomonas palustris (strain HaA2) TaxID=316058 RepID=Q2IS37_RHOP2|nr:methyl-accepting chemotaxis protein [Rhodopseudomonas palustris]ABD08973.1 methyl-accepting chemotaxis sensory transducer [Rhodopseudomonas palustris HaA2]
MPTNFSIRAKISLVVGFLLITIIGMGILAVTKTQAINTAAVDIQSNWLPRVRALGDLRAEVVTYRAIVRLHLLSETADTKAAVENRIETSAQALRKFRDVYEKLIGSAEERALYNEWSEQWNLYESQIPRVVALSRDSIGRIPHDATAFNETKAYPISKQADAILDRDIALNNKGADEAGRFANQVHQSALMQLLIIIGAAIVLGGGLAIYLVRDVSRGIDSIVAPMQALGAGDLGASVPHQGEATEIGKMADSLQLFKEALIAKKAADEAAMKDAAEKIQRGQRVDEITRHFEQMIGEIVETVASASTELEASAGTLTATADRAQQLTTSVAAASGQASANVQSVASATEELTSSVQEISRQVQESARIAAEAVDQARDTNQSVGQLTQAAARIGAVVELINTIAGQTNLLALNATIEAARAGDAGRGFAVVASEVKALAEQTAKATGEISQQISGIQSATQESAGAIMQIGQTIARMSEISSTIAAAVEEQGAATHEIARNVQQAAQGTHQVSSNIGDVQRGASETGAASSQVLSAAQSLSTESNRLKLEVGNFLSNVRAA